MIDPDDFRTLISQSLAESDQAAAIIRDSPACQQAMGTFAMGLYGAIFELRAAGIDRQMVTALLGGAFAGGLEECQRVYDGVGE